MSFTLPAAALFPLAGAANALVLSLALGARAVTRRSPAGLYGAGFLAGAATATVVITLDHAGVQAGGWLHLTEGLLTLAGGALFALFVAALLDRKLSPVLMLAPAAVFVIVATAAPGFALSAFRIEALVLVQAAFTALAAWMAFLPKQEGRLQARRRFVARLAVGAMIVIHLAQVVRAVSASDAVRDAVPYAIATMFFALAGLVYFGARASALDPIFAERTPSPAAADLLGRLDEAIAKPTLLRKTNLGIAEAAAALAVTPSSLAKALAAERRLSFKEYLLRARVNEAKRLLGDPGEARTSMEAVGLLAGFGSRSAFYKAFREQTGLSPAAFRAESCPES